MGQTPLIIAQVRAMDQRLTELKHPHKLVVYDGDDHSINKHRAEFNAELVAWFKERLSNQKPK